MYESEEVERAIALRAVAKPIALFKVRKREKQIENPSGYFVAALQGDWSSQNLVVEESGDCEVDTRAVFCHWYELARQLGYCSGQETRKGEQWVCCSGSWERWEDIVERGFTLSYLKKTLKRNQG